MAMTLSTKTVETLLDLVEIKLSCFEVWDREDRRERQALEACKRELTQALASPSAAPGELVAFQPARARRAAAG
jgi:hypothetical protein